MKRKVRPATVALEPCDLRKPLPHHVEASPVAGALDDDGQLVVEDDFERNQLSWRDRSRQRYARVGFVVITRPMKLRGRPEVDRGAVRVSQRQFADVHPSPVLGRGASSSTDPLAKKRGR